MDRTKVLVVSSVVPSARGSGGELILYRHLESSPNIDYKVVQWREFPFRLRLIGKLKQLGFHSLSQSWECLFPVLPAKKLTRDWVERFRPDLILTVAHGWWHLEAKRIAREFNLPLLSFFQDWWPDFPQVPVAFRSRAEREFRRTCAESALAVCVSDGMRKELGEPPNSLVIPPIPSRTKSRILTRDMNLPLRIVYFGNLHEYGPLIEGALRILKTSKRVRLEVFGASPLWTRKVENEFRSMGLYHGFLPSDQLVDPLQQFNAVLVVMSFDRALRRRMTTSFPSKMIEGMQLGLPTVVWGPEYCSAVQWARLRDRALCVTNSAPDALRGALEDLAASPLEQERLAKSAREAADTEFDPERIQAQFLDALNRATQARSDQNRRTFGKIPIG